MAINASPLDDLAEDLTRVLNIPFKATGRDTLVFREPLRVTDWSVPMIFDGHAARDGDALAPAGFVGHVLFAALRSTARSGDGRPWWTCTLSEHGARAVVEAVDQPEDDGWLIGLDVLLDDRPAPVVAPRKTRPLDRQVA